MTLWVTTLAIIIADIPLLLCLLAVSLIFMFLSRGKTGWKAILSIKRLLPLFLTLIIIQGFLRSSSDPLFSFYFLRFSREGGYLGILVSLRLIILLISAAILGRLSYTDFRNALFYLPEEMSFMISFVVHLIPGIRREYLRYMRVLNWRGLELKRQRYRVRLHLYKVVSLSVLAGLLSGSTMQAVSLELRGFRRPGKKTFINRLYFVFTDYLIIGILCLSLILILHLLP